MLTFETAILVYWVRLEGRRIFKAADIKASPARNASEFGWEQLGKTIAQVQILQEKMAVLEDRVAQTMRRNQTRYWEITAVISAISGVIAILAFLGVRP